VRVAAYRRPRKMFGRLRGSHFSCTPANEFRPTNFATRCGSSPKERVLIIGFPGLLFYIRVRSVDSSDSDGACFARGNFAHGVGILRLPPAASANGSEKTLP